MEEQATHTWDMDFEAGEILLVDKPLGWTSFDVVKKLRNTIHLKKIGHAGTLDPLATGLLIVCTGKKTKQIDQLMAETKEYTGTLVLGATTPSYDKETEPDQTFPWEHITREAVEAIIPQFLGDIQQYPPVYSAISVNGQKLYKLARRGEEVELKPRSVRIDELEITRMEGPEVDFRVVCGKGTYIRSLAHDMGKALGSGAYLSALCRTRIGDFRLTDARDVEGWVNHIRQGADAGTIRIGERKKRW